MATNVKVDFSELERFVIEQKLMPFKIQEFFKSFISELAEMIIAKTVLKTPVDTGALRASWGIETSNIYSKQTTMKSEYYQNKYGKDKNVKRTVYEYSGNIKFKGGLFKKISVTLMNPQEYASYIENGFMKTDGSWYQGKQMLRRSINEIIPKIYSHYYVKLAEFKALEGLG